MKRGKAGRELVETEMARSARTGPHHGLAAGALGSETEARSLGFRLLIGTIRTLGTARASFTGYLSTE